MKDGVKIGIVFAVLIAIIIVCRVFCYCFEIKNKSGIKDITYNWQDNITIVIEASVADRLISQPVVQTRKLALTSNKFSTKDIEATNVAIDSMIIDMINIREKQIYNAKMENRNKIKNSLKTKGCIEKNVNGRSFIACPMN